MKKLIPFVLLIFLATSGLAQEVRPVVSINAKGEDVRSVIHDLFKQAGKNYVMNPGVRFVLYLSLDKIDFQEALNIVCKNASLKYEVHKGVYHIANAPKVQPKPEEDNTPTEDKLKVEPKIEKLPTKPKGTLPNTVLAKRVTTRLQKKEIKDVFAILSKQTGITIEVSEEIPAFKLDVFLINTSLKYALDEITRATKLKYRMTDNLSIAIEK